VDSAHGNPNWLVTLYQSVFHFILGLLNLFQELFKSGSEKGQMSSNDEDVGSRSVAHDVIGGTGRVAPAGDFSDPSPVAKESANAKTYPDHTVVDLPSEGSRGSKEKAAVEAPFRPPQTTTSTTPGFNFPSTYTPIEPTVDQSKNTLVIKNLPFKYKPVDLDTLLNDHQAKPKNVRLLRDDAGRFSGMAFIRCTSKEEAQRLILNMNDLDIGGRNIQVEFKMKKKKKSKLGCSSDDASSLSSSDEPRTSADNTINDKVSAPVQVQPSSLQVQQERSSAAPRKLAMSAEGANISDKFRKLPQMRRKSTSVLEAAPAYAHSALSRIHPTLSQASAGPSGLKPIRQPYGPDGKTNGFSLEYRKLRGHL